MDRETYLGNLRRDGARLIEVARTAPSAEIPSCPRWDMRALVGHTTSVHAWVAGILEDHLQTRPHLRRVDELVGDFEAIAAEYESNLDRLLVALKATSEDEMVWNWSDRAPAPARFWFRRMAQETVMHRVDAELGTGSPSPIDAALAADGIGEFLGFVARYVPDELVGGVSGTIAFCATDVDGEWRFLLESARIEPTAGDVDATVSGPASDLYRWVLHRDLGEVTSLALSGDHGVIDAWGSVKFE
jgi:uncharacterized protein (TIGR03083 family)